MFNIMDTELHDSIVRSKQQKMLENERLDDERRASSRLQVLTNVANQYQNLNETTVSKAFNRKNTVDNAVISKLRDVTYQIFEGALLIDDEPKAYYSDVIKKQFDSAYDKLLDSLDIKSLSAFKKNLGTANRVYSTVLEQATNFANINAGIFESVISDSSDYDITKSIIEACNIISEATGSTESKTAKVLETITKVRDRLAKSDKDMKTIIECGVDIKRILYIALAAVSMWVAISEPYIGLIMFFLTVLAQEYVREEREDNAHIYLQQVKDIKAGLIAMKSKVDVTDKSIAKIEKQIKRCDTLIENLKIKYHWVGVEKGYRSIDPELHLLGNGKPIHEDAISAGENLLASMDDDKVSDFADKVKNAVALDTDIAGKEVLLDNISKLEESGMDEYRVVKCLGILYEAATNVKLSYLSEECNRKLKEGEMPAAEDFYTDNDNKALDDLSEMGGKNFAIQKIKDKIVKVITDEEELAVKKQKANDDMLNSMSTEKLESMKSNINEASGMRLGSSDLNMPDSLFSAIVMNRSKKMLTESSSVNIDPIMNNKDTILAESIVLYTILETFNTLNLKKYNASETRDLMNQYYYNKI